MLTRSITSPLLATIGLMMTGALAAPVPANLQGQWEYGSVSPIEYYDPSSGKYAEGSGTSEIIRIRPDGTYERNGIIVVSTYGCTSKLLSVSSGTVSIKGNLITFTPKKAHQKGYSCSPGNSFESHNLTPAQFTWKLQDTVLILGDPTGKSTDSRYNRPRTLGAPAPSTNRAITGRITAPAGMSLDSTTVIACPVDGGCGDPKVKLTPVVGTGNTGTFSFQGLEPIAYEIFAWDDANGNGEPDEGDWVDTSSATGASGVMVTPPASSVTLTLVLWK